MPKFPSDVAPSFKAMCETITDEAKLQELREAVQAVLVETRQQAEENAVVDVDRCEELAETCLYLLEHYHDFGPKQQALIIGAVRYFAVTDDPFDDGMFASGFFDDCKIMNYVLEQLGIEDRYLKTR
ncbi:MAG: hypothetical protein GX589_10025 [Deltaproteobacteria bacterium]|nr:hypothetical protein [Deltaproteobacteria bacterium]